MDWNLNPSKKQKAVDRVLDDLETKLEKKPGNRPSTQANAVDLQDALQQRHATTSFESQSEPGRNQQTGSFKKQNRVRDKWFDAR
jgi:hypothetical protein